jgi:hypothetical protein
MRKNLVAIAGMALLISACRFFTAPEGVSPGEGLVALRIGTGANQALSVLPGVQDLGDVSRFSLYGTASAVQDAPESLLADFYDGLANALVYVRPGNWKFTLKGFSPEDNLLVQGSLQRLIAANSAEILHFTLAVPDAPQGGTGFVRITLTLPLNSGVVSVVTTVDGEALDPPLEIETGAGGAQIVYEDDEILTGDHLITFLLYDGAANLVAAWTEMAVIKGNILSAKTINLTGNDLNGPPAAPSALRATAWDGSALTLGWTVNSYNETGFVLSDGTTDYPLPAGSSSYEIDLASLTPTIWTLKAVNSFGESAEAEHHLNPAAPPIPGGLSAGTATPSSISLSWTAVLSAGSYKVYRSGSAGGTYTEVGTANTAAYTDTGLSPETSYYYKVSAVNLWGESGLSASIEGTTRPLSPITNISYVGSWTLEGDGSRTSPVTSARNTTKMRVNFTSTVANASITILLEVSGGSNNYYAFISTLDNGSATVSSGYYSGSQINGTTSVPVTIPVPAAGNHFIDICFYNGSLGSGSSFDGIVRFTVIPIGSGEILNDRIHGVSYVGNWALQNDGSRTSPVTSAGSTTKERVFFTSTVANASITILLEVSGGSNNYYAFISTLDNGSATSGSSYPGSLINGTTSVPVTIPVPAAGNHFIDICFYNGSSGSGSSFDGIVRFTLVP